MKIKLVTIHMGDRELNSRSCKNYTVVNALICHKSNSHSF